MVQGRAPPPRTPDDEALISEGLSRGAAELVLYTDGEAAHRETAERIRAWAREAGEEDRVKERRPRRAYVQRRVVLELAHELDDAQREDCVREWAEEVLSREGVAWHACVHVPEAGNDARNFHAHVVYTQFAVEAEADRPGWTFEREPRLPEQAELIKVLSGNGPGRRQGRTRKLRAWRARLAEIGADKRYDPRSYAEQGRAHLVPGAHRGPERSRIEERGAAYVSRGPAPSRRCACTRVWTELVTRRCANAPPRCSTRSRR